MADIKNWKTGSFEEKYKSMMKGMSEADNGAIALVEPGFPVVICILCRHLAGS